MVHRILVIGMICAASFAHADYMDHFAVREDVGPHKAPSLGDSSLLLIPIEVAGFPPIDTAQLERFFSPDDPVGFVTYYQTASLGRYRPRVTVAPKVHYQHCPLPEATFPGCRVPRGDIAALTSGMNMMREVVQKANEAGLDFAAFDVNGRRGKADGWIDGVMLLTNVPFGGIAFPFGYFNQDDNLAGSTGGPLVVDGVKIGHFAIAGDSDPFVMVHEFGHLLGLTDLYDESGHYEGLNLSVMGAWHYDPNIPLPDAETRFRLRWANWHQVQGRQRVTIHPVESSGEVYRLGTGDEYFLVENRGPGGTFDRSVPARALAVFHVDRKVKLKGEEGEFVHRILDCVNCDPWHPFIRLIQADGRFDVEHDKPFDQGDLFGSGASLGPDLSALPVSVTHQVNSSNFYSGAVSGLRIDEIQVLDDGSITLTLEAPDTGQCEERLCADGDGCAPVVCGVAPGEGKTTGCMVGEGLGPVLGLLLLKKRFGRRKEIVFRRA